MLSVVYVVEHCCEANGDIQASWISEVAKVFFVNRPTTWHGSQICVSALYQDVTFVETIAFDKANHTFSSCFNRSTVVRVRFNQRFDNLLNTLDEFTLKIFDRTSRLGQLFFVVFLFAFFHFQFWVYQNNIVILHDDIPLTELIKGVAVRTIVILRTFRTQPWANVAISH